VRTKRRKIRKKQQLVRTPSDKKHAVNSYIKGLPIFSAISRRVRKSKEFSTAFHVRGSQLGL
jgi:hypothetical protein